jgi:hypothetical protein
MRALHVTDVEALRTGSFGFLWRPVRHAFGIEAFGTNAYSQPEAGGELIEEHDETGSGAGSHQELYVVLEGTARFTVGGETFDAPAGTLVFFDDPAERRAAVAAVPNTTVLAIGGKVGEPFAVSPWEFFFRADAALRAGDRDAALRALEEGLERHGESVAMQYNAACLFALAGERKRAVQQLRRAVDLDPAKARQWAAGDSDLDAIRDEPEVRQLLGS